MKQNKENLVLKECRVILEDVLQQKNKQGSQSSAEQNLSMSSNKPNDEPDLMEVVDVENFEQNGLKARRQPNPIQTLVSTINKMKKQIEAMQVRIDQLENDSSTKIATTVAQSSVDVDNPADIDGNQSDLLTNIEDVDISAFGSFVLDMSLNTLENALSVSEIGEMLEA